MTTKRHTAGSRHDAVVLLIVLAFIVLLTALVLAYFSRTTATRSVSKSSANATAADVLARSALDIVVGDVQQEIANRPAVSSANVAPQRSPTPAPGTTPAIPNLIRRSVRADAISAPAISSRASAVNSTSDPSQNGRSISLARWNSHYFVPKAKTGDDSSDPITTGYTAPEFWAPDWVFVTRTGPSVLAAWNPNLADATSTNTSFVVGRYAYAMYDEGGLLDFNVAGYPYPSPSPAITPAALINNIGRKGTTAFADLTGMRTSGNSTPGSATITNMVAWRNYATIQSAGTFPNLTSVDPTATSFVNYALNTSSDFRTVAAATYRNRTDQALVTRKELIELFASIGASFNMLKNLGTFSRETNQPTWGGLLTARFPLSRFDLFAALPPSAADAGSIQKYFGLKYVPAATSGTTATAEHWIYIGIAGSTRQVSVPKLTAKTADTDLPTLLQYALPSSPIGEILSIEASLIDQRDGGSDDTTWIEYGDPSGPPQLAWGVDKNPPPSPAPYPPGAVVIDRAFRNVGDLGYAYRNASTKLDFRSGGSTDAPLLDLFTYNTSVQRAGIVNLNTQNPAVLAALLQSAITNDSSSDFVGRTDAASNHAKTAYAAATPMVDSTIGGREGTAIKSLVGRQDTTRLAAAAGNALGSTPEAQETATRALAELGQTRTWGLFIDVIAQSGRYSPSATGLSQFVVEGEKRYWLHIAIDRFTNRIIDQQIEAVLE